MELDLFPKGYITSPTSWKAPEYRGETCNSRDLCGQSINLTWAAPASEWHGMYQNWTVGVGGACDVYDPPRSPWCSGDFYLSRQFPEMHARHPTGVDVTGHLPNMPYSAPGGAVVHAWRPAHWYTWMFEVDSSSVEKPVTTWTRHC